MRPRRWRGSQVYAHFWASAACTRNEPRWGFLLQAPAMASIALRSTLRTPEARGPPVGLLSSRPPARAFLDPPFESPLDGGFMHPEVPCDALRGPPFYE